MTCKDCAYFWREENEEYPSCHYHSLGVWDPAPCERENDEEPEDYLKIVFDKEDLTRMCDVTSEEFKSAKVEHRTYCIFREDKPTFREVCEYAKHIETCLEKWEFADNVEHVWRVDIISGLYGELYATRDEYGLWEIIC